MRTLFLLKIVLVLPVLLFADYLLMIVIGSCSCLFTPGMSFYCNHYCIAGKIILTLSALFFLYLIFPEIRSLFRSAKNGQAKKNTENY